MRMKNFILTLYLCLFTFSLFSQGQNAVRPLDLVNQAKESGQVSQLAPLSSSVVRNSQIPEELVNYSLLDFDRSFFSAYRSDNALIEMRMPSHYRNDMILQLVEVDINNGGNQAIELPANTMKDVSGGKHFRGIVKGDENSVVALSVFEDQVMGLITGHDDSNLVIGKLEGSEQHIIYADKDLAGLYEGLSCATSDDGPDYSLDELREADLTTRAANNCVKLYIEVDYDIYKDKGSTTEAATNFAQGFMNQVMTMYANENIVTSLNPVGVWTSDSGFSGSSASTILSQWQNSRSSSWEGTLGGLVSYKASGGIAAGFAGICNSNRSNSMCFSNIRSSYANLPTYSWNVDVVTHEFGHLFGSRHTHACVWNGNNTAIDGCAGYVEGNCSNPGNPSGKGTVMSYCHNTVGKDLSLGFGTQPGNVIRNRVYNASCLSSDCGGSGGGGNGDGCTTPNVSVTFKTDNYPSENSWTIKNSSGSVVVQNGTLAKNTSVTTDKCLPAGCYTFEIKDSYGDGVCCNYGSGSFSLKVNGTEVLSGSNFGSSATKQFCISDGSDTEKPSTPSGLNATEINTTSVKLAWTASTDNVGVTGYNVYMDGNKIGTSATNSAEITGLKAATTYAFKVSAYDAAGNESAQSVSKSVTTKSESTGGCQTVKVELTTDKYATETSWTLKDANGNVVLKNGTLAASSTSTEEKCLAAGCYTFEIKDTYGDGICCTYGNGSYKVYVGDKVVASGSQFTSSESKEVCVQSSGADTQAPTAPSNLSASELQQTSVKLSWAASTDNVGVTGYDVYQNGSKIGSVNGSTLTASVTGLTPSTAYKYIVKAKDAAGNVSGGSNELSITTASNASATVKVTVTTDRYGNENSWEIKDASGTVVMSGNGFGNSQTYTSSKELSGCYTFTIKDSYGDGMCCTYGNGSYKLEVNGNVVKSGGSFSSSESTEFCTSGSSQKGMDPIAVNTQALAIYPNPNNTNNLVIKTTVREAQYVITNTQGAVLLRGAVQGSVDISSLNNGVYVVRVTDSEGIKSVAEKLIVIR